MMEVNESVAARVKEMELKFREVSNTRFTQLCLKHDIKGLQKNELGRFIASHLRCIRQLASLYYLEDKHPLDVAASFPTDDPRQEGAIWGASINPPKP